MGGHAHQSTTDHRGGAVGCPMRQAACRWPDWCVWWWLWPECVLLAVLALPLQAEHQRGTLLVPSLVRVSAHRRP